MPLRQPQRAAAGLAKPPLWIRGYEADPRLITPARNNIERAGLNDVVTLRAEYSTQLRPQWDE